MSTYCRITGKSRGLPKPHYFPLLPPISPADAKRLCRITGKSYGLPTHHYIPVVTVLSKKRKVRCQVTAKADGQEGHHFVPASSDGGVKHAVLKSFRYVVPVLNANADLLELLDTKEDAAGHDGSTKFVYTVHERQYGLVLPSRLEAAVRDGDIRDMMLAKDADKLVLKLRKGASVEVDIRDTVIDDWELFEGEGPNQDIVIKRKRQQRKLGESDWRRKIFEDKEKQAESEEERLSQIIRSKKRSKVGKSLSSVKESPVLCSWKNVSCADGGAVVRGDVEYDEKVRNSIMRALGTQNLADIVNSVGSDNEGSHPLVRTLPSPLKIDVENVDLCHSLPGLIQQPVLASDGVIGFRVASVITPFRPNMAQVDVAVDDALNRMNADKAALKKILDKQNALLKKRASMFIQVDDIPAAVASISKLMERGSCDAKHKLQQGIKVIVKDVEKFVPGQFIASGNREIFVPGNVVETPTGPHFLPGFAVLSDEGDSKFVPGCIVKDQNDPTGTFVAGQMVLTRDGEKFVQGQTIVTKDGVRFMPGQTVFIGDDVKFVPGQVVEDQKTEGGFRFVPGQTVMTSEGAQFLPGQFVETSAGLVIFQPGQSVLNENFNWEFVQGQNFKTDDGDYVFVPGKELNDVDGPRQFVPGRVLIDENQVEIFVPGVTISDENGKLKFVPGLELENEDGPVFVEGVIAELDDNKYLFVPGKVAMNNKDCIDFERAESAEKVVLHDIISQVGVSISSLNKVDDDDSVIFGHMVHSSQGVEFFPGEAIGLPAGKVIPGRLVKGDEIRFIPGTMIDNKFIPGQFVTTDKEEKFIPGQVIETDEGPKFVPGQVLQTSSGPKFVPGQTMDTDSGPKFIPGQIIETKSGPTFIPGQVISTDEEGSRFVPGQVVDTVEGPRFVPGRVVETGDHVTFIPGQIVETEDGLKFVAPDLEDDPEGGYQFTLQGFEVAQEELRMIQRNTIPHACLVGQLAIDWKMLQQLSDAGMAVGRQIPVDIPDVDIKSSRVAEIACTIANNLNIDPSYSIQMNHILSNVLQIVQSNVSLPEEEEVKDEHLKKLMNLAEKCEYGVDSPQFLNVLGDAVESIIKTDLDHKQQIINNLHAVTVDLAAKVREKQMGKILPSPVAQVARKMASKLNLDGSSSIKMSHILSNIQQLKELNVAVLDEEIADENVKTFLSIALDSADGTEDGEYIQVLGKALENAIKIDVDNQSESIDALETLTNNLASKVRRKKTNKLLSVPVIETACQVAARLGLDPTQSTKISHILSDLQQIKQSNILVSNNDIENEDCRKLLDVLKEFGCKGDVELLPALGNVLENIINKHSDNKLQEIDFLHAFTANLMQQTSVDEPDEVFPSTIIAESACKVASKLKVGGLESIKINDILLNLHEIKLSKVPVPKEKIADDNLKMLLNLVSEYQTNTDNHESVGAFAAALEKTLMVNSDQKLETINKLQTLTASLADDIYQQKINENLPLPVIEFICKIADELNLEPSYAKKMGKIIVNLQQIKQAKLPSPNGKIKDKNLKNLLHFVSQIDANKSGVKLFLDIAEALSNIVKVDSNKERVVNTLLALTDDLILKVRASKIRVQPAPPVEVAHKIANKLKVGSLESMKIKNILSNLQQIQALGVHADVPNNESLKTLLKCAAREEDNPNKEEFFLKLGSTLEDIVSASPETALRTIETLYNLTEKLQADAKEKELNGSLSLNVIENAYQLSKNLNLSPTQSIKMGQILTNLRQIKESKQKGVLNAELKDENLKTLLDFSEKCEAEGCDVLLSLEKAVENTIKIDPDRKLNTIDSLHNSTSKLLSNVRKKPKNKHIAEMVHQITQKFKVDEPTARKISKIFTNMQQIKQSNVTVLQNVEDKNLKNLLNLALEFDNCKADPEILQSLSSALEAAIKTDVTHKLKTIDDLHLLASEYAEKAESDQKHSTLFTILPQIASAVADELSVDHLHSIKISKILSNLHLIQQSGVDVFEETQDEKLKSLLQAASVAAPDSQLWLQSVSDAFKNVVKKDLTNKFNTISTLYALTEDLASNVQEKQLSQVIQVPVAEKASKISKKLQLNAPNSVKVGQIIQNVLQISKAKGILTNGKVKDKNLKTLLKVANEFKDGASPEFLEVLGVALEKVISVDLDHKQQTINTLHSLAVDLASSVCGQQLTAASALPIAEMASQLADNVNADLESSIKINSILSNVQQIKQLQSSISPDEIIDENLRILLNAASETGGNFEGVECLQIVCDALENIIKVDLDHKEQNINALHASAINLAAKLQGKRSNASMPIPVLEVACKVAEKMNIDPSHAIKMSCILSNAQILGESDLADLKDQIKDENLKSLLQMTLKCVQNADNGNFLLREENLENIIQSALENKQQTINALHAMTVNLTSKVREKQTNKILSAPVFEKATKVASNLNVDPTYALKMSNILANLQQIKLSNVAVFNDEIADENLKKLLIVVSSCENVKGEEQVTQILGDALENIIKEDPMRKLQHIDVLQALTAELVSNIATKQVSQTQSSPIAEVACKVANKLNVGPSHSIKMSHIISNLKQIRESHVAILDEITDPNLKKLVDIAMELTDDKNQEEFFQTLGNALEDVICVDLDHKLQTIDNLHSLTVNLTSCVSKRESSKTLPLRVIEMACSVASKLDIDPSYSVKMGHILSNLQQIKQSNVPVFTAEINDVNLKTLLNVALECNNDEVDEKHFLQKIGNALQNSISEDMEHKLQSINTLYMLTSELSSKVRIAESGKILSLPTIETACKIASNLNIDPSHTIKLSQIISNVKQIKESNVKVPREMISHESLEKVVSVFAECQNCDENEVLPKVGNALKLIISADPDNKHQTINLLFEASEGLAKKLSHQQSKSLPSPLIVDLAGKVTKYLKLEPANSVPISFTLWNLQQMSSANLSEFLKGDVADVNLKALLKAALKFGNKRDISFIKSLCETLQKIIKGDADEKVNIIRMLCSSTTDLVSQIVDDNVNSVSSLESKFAESILKTCNLDESNAVLIENILCNLQKVKESKLPSILKNGVKDENLQRVLDLVSECDECHDKPQALAMLSKTLELVLTENGNDKQKLLAVLHATTTNLVENIPQTADSILPPPLVAKLSESVVKKMKIEPKCAILIDHILQNFQQIKKSDIKNVLNNGIADKVLDNILKTTVDCDVDAVEAAQLFSDVICNSIKGTKEEKEKKINALYTAVNNLCESSSEKVNKASSDILEAAVQLIEKFKMNPSNSIQVVQILNNLQKIKKSNLPNVLMKGNLDENVQMVLTVIDSCNEDSDEVEQMKVMSNALKKILEENPKNELQKISILHATTNELASCIKMDDKSSFPIVAKASQKVVQEMKVDASCVPVIEHILQCMLQINTKDIKDMLNNGIKDESLTEILNDMLRCEGQRLSSVQVLSDMMVKSIKGTKEQKEQKIGTLYVSVNNLQKSPSLSSSALVTEISASLIRNLGLKDTDSFLVVQILNNAQKIKNSNIPHVLQKGLIDKNLQHILNLASVTGELQSEKQQMKSIGDTLESIIVNSPESKTQVISMLHAATSDLASTIQLGSSSPNPLVAQVSLNLAEKLKVSPSCAVLIEHALQNIQKIEKSDISRILNNGLKNEELRDILKVAQECGSDDTEVVRVLCDVLQKNIKGTLEQKESLINSLYLSAFNLVSNMEDEPWLTSDVADIVAPLTAKLDLNPSSSRLMISIINNVQTLGKSNIPNLLRKGAVDENVQIILDLLQVSSEKPNEHDQLKAIGGFLENIMTRDVRSNKLQILNILHATSSDLVASVLPQSTTSVPFAQVTKLAELVVEKMNISSAYSTLVEHVLQNVQLLQKGEIMKILDQENVDRTLKEILKVALKSDCVDLSTAQQLGDVFLREMKNSCREEKEQKIISLYGETCKFNSNLIEKPSLSVISEIASPLVAKLGLSPSDSTLIVQTFHNLQKIQNSCLNNVLQGNVVDENLKMLLNLIPSSLEPVNKIDQLHEIGNRLEELICQNPEQKFLKIITLHAASTKLASNVPDNSVNTLSASIVKVSKNLAKNTELNPSSIVLVEQMLQNLHKIEKADLKNIMKKGVKNKNLCELIKSVIKYDSQDENAVQIVSETLEKLANSSPEDNDKIISELYNSVCDIMPCGGVQISDNIPFVPEITAPLIAKLSLDPPNAAPIAEILSNLQKMKKSSLINKLQKGCTDGNVQVLLNLVSALDENMNGTEQVQNAYDILKKIIGENSKEHSTVINTLHAVSKDLASNVFVGVLCDNGEKFASNVIRKMNLKPSASVLVEQIVENVRKLEKSDARAILNKGIIDDTLRDLVKTTLKCDSNESSEEIVQKLAAVLQNSVKGNTDQKEQKLKNLYTHMVNVLSDLSENSKDQIPDLFSNAIKLAKRLNLPSSSSAILGHLILNLQQIKTSDLHQVLQQGGLDECEGIKLIADLISSTDTVRNNAKLPRIIERALEDKLIGTSDDKLRTINALHAISVDLISNKFNHQVNDLPPPCVAKKAGDLIKKTKLNRSNAPLVRQIIWNLQKIDKVSLQNLLNRGVEDVDLKYLLQSALDSNNQNELTQILTDVLQIVLKRHPGHEEEKINFLYSSIINLLTGSPKESINYIPCEEVTKVAFSLSKKLDLNPMSSTLIESIFHNVLKIQALPLSSLIQKSELDNNTKMALNLVLECDDSVNDDGKLKIFERAIENLVNGDEQQKMKSLNLLHSVTSDMISNLRQDQVDKSLSPLTEQVARVVAKKLNVNISNVPLIENVLHNLQQMPKIDLKDALSYGVVDESLKSLMDDAFDCADESPEKVIQVLAQSLQNVVTGSPGDKEEKISSLYASTFNLISNVENRQMNLIGPFKRLKLAKDLATLFEMTPEKSKLIEQVLFNLQQIKYLDSLGEVKRVSLDDDIRKIIELSSEFDEEGDRNKLSVEFGRILENFISGDAQEKLEKLTILHAASVDAISQANQKLLINNPPSLIKQIAEETAKKVNLSPSYANMIERAIWNLQQLSAADIKSILKKDSSGQNESVKILLKMLVERNEDVGEVTVTLGNAIQKIIKGNSEQKEQKLGELYSSTFQLLIETQKGYFCESPSVSTEVVIPLVKRLQLDLSNSSLVEHLLFNLRKIKKSALPRLLLKGVEDESVQMVLNLISKSPDADEETEQTKLLGDALETLIAHNPDQKIPTICKVHAAALDLLPAVHCENTVMKPLIPFVNASKVLAKRMSVDERKAVVIEKILANLENVRKFTDKAVLKSFIPDDNFKKIVEVAFNLPSNTCREKFAQIVGDTLQSAISGTVEQKENELNDFYAKTIDLLPALVNTSDSNFSPSDVAEAAKLLAKTLKLDSTSVAPLRQILSNVQTIKKSRLSNVLKKGVVDEKMHPVVNLLLMSEGSEANTSELHSTCDALQKVLNQYSNEKLQVLNLIHASTVDLVGHITAGQNQNHITMLPSFVVDAGKIVAEKIKLDDSHAKIIPHILWNVQQATKMYLNNVLSKGITDESFKKLLHTAVVDAADCKTDAESIQALGDALELIVQGDEKEKNGKVDSLYALSVNLLAGASQEKTENSQSPIVAQVTHKLMKKLKVSPWHATLIGHVLCNLKKIKQSNIAILTEKGVVDDYVKMVADLMSKCDGSKNENEMMQAFSSFLEKNIHGNEKQKFKMLNKLHAASLSILSKMYCQQVVNKTPPVVAEIAKNVSEKLKLDSSAAKLVEHIIWNVQQLNESNSRNSFQNGVVSDDVITLLDAAAEIGDGKNRELIAKKIGEKLKTIVKGDTKERMQKINELYSSAVNSCVQSRDQSARCTLPAVAEQIANNVAEKLKMDPWHAKLIGHVLCNLKQIQQTSSSPTSDKGVLDENLQAIIDLAVEYQSCTNKSDILPAFGAALEKTIRGDADWKLQSISQLHAATVEELSKAHRQQALSNPPPFVVKASAGVAKKLNLVRSSAVLLGHLLWNLQQIRKSDLQNIIQRGTMDKSLQKLVAIALENYDKGRGKVTELLGESVCELLKNDLTRRDQKIDALYASSVNLLSNFGDSSAGNLSNVVQAALQIADKLKINDLYSEKVGHILSNLQQIKRANVAFLGENYSDESLKVLLQLALENTTGDKGRPSLEQMRNALESSILVDLERKLQTINALHSKTANLASKVKDKQSNKFIPVTAIETACKVASKLNIDPSYSVKISGILSNLQEIKQSNAPFIYQKITEESLRKLLDLSLECDDLQSGAELLRSLGDALEKTIKADLAHKLETIDSLHTLTLDLTSKVREEQSKKILPVSVIERACKVASNLQIDPAVSIKMSNILSNLLRIKQSFVLLRDDEIADDNLKLLWKVASTCEDGPEGIKFFQTVGDLLESVIQTDMSHKEQIINSLFSLTSDLLSKIRYRRPNKTILLKNLIRNNIIIKDDVVEKLSSILIEDERGVRAAFQHMSEENPEFIDKVLKNAASMLKYIPADEKKTADTLHRAIIKAVAETSEQKVQKVLQKVESEDFHSLVGDAIGLAKALGLGDVVIMLNDILKDVKSIPILAKDPIVMEVLKRLTIMRQLAGKRPNFGFALHELQLDPYAARNDPRLRQLVRESAVLMVIPEESFVLRSSEDIPCSLFFGDNSLAVEDFMVKSRQSGSTFLILKRGVQMVVPREAARDVLTGKVPYTLLDENGIQHFKPLHVFNALNLPKVATNRFSNYGYSPKIPKPARSPSTSRGSDDAKKNVLNGSCSSQEVNNSFTVEWTAACGAE